jgi:GNAT superfamily N-acetyltransferase
VTTPALTVREAVETDLPALIAMLADDHLGAAREDTAIPPRPAYVSAFEAMRDDPNQMLAVGEIDGEVIATLQLSFLPSLSRQGMWRGLVEGVRVRADWRGKGLGEALMAWAVETCRARGCGLVQLTTDLSRKDAHRFYDRLGFSYTHAGFKLQL